MFSNVVILDVNMFSLVIEDKKEKKMMNWRERSIPPLDFDIM